MIYDIDFIIITWNSERYIGNCIRSILGMCADALTGRIFIIDNGSTDQTVPAIRKIEQQYCDHANFECTLTALDRNTGTSYARNLGIKEAIASGQGQYICILDSDTMVNTDAMLSLIYALEANPHCGIVGPRMRDSRGTYQCSGRNFPTLTEKLLKVCPFEGLRNKGIQMQSSIPESGVGTVPVGYLLSACWMIKKEVFLQAGLLDERFFYAPEDAEFCLRCWKAGYAVLYCYDAEIIHEWQRISRQRLLSKHNFEHIKGLVHMFVKHRYMLKAPNLKDMAKGGWDEAIDWRSV